MNCQGNALVLRFGFLGIRMRTHHFLLILFCIATNLLVFESVLSLSRVKQHKEVKLEIFIVQPMGDESAVIQSRQN